MSGNVFRSWFEELKAGVPVREVVQRADADY